MPIAWAAAIGAAGSIAGGLIQSSGQGKAAQTQQNMFNTITANESPYMNEGNAAEGALSKLLGTSGGSFGGLPNGYLTQTFNPTQSQLENYPGYKFQLQQGQNAIRSADAPGVGAVSGPALKDLMSFNQGLAGTNYGNYFNQFQTQQNNIFNRLSTIAGLGQNAAGNVGNNGATLGTGIAQAQAGQAASIAGGVSGAANTAGNYIALNSLMNSGSGNGSTSADSTYSGGYSGPATTDGYS